MRLQRGKGAGLKGYRESVRGQTSPSQGTGESVNYMVPALAAPLICYGTSGQSFSLWEPQFFLLAD